MNQLNYFLLTSLLIFSSDLIFSQSFNYISPKDKSTLVSLSTNIILKSSDNVDPLSLSPDKFTVIGSISGIHSGAVKLSNDNKTILFYPDIQFSANEEVKVNVNRSVKTTGGEVLPSVTIRFKTTPLKHPVDLNDLTSTEIRSTDNYINKTVLTKSSNKRQAVDTLPSDFPKITVGTSDNPAPGNIFITNKAQGTNNSIGNYLMIVNNDGSAAKYKKLPQVANLFKIEPNGNFSWSYANGAGGYFVTDTSLATIDTFQCGNGYKLDAHDFLLLPNGHAVLFANDAEPVDMSQIVPGGNPEASVTGLIVQELDASKNVIFQWRSWDYLPITDSYFDLTLQNVDLIHTNGLATDLDGNILVSMRHLSSIVKINRETGDIMWILGGKQNEFTFLGEHSENAPTYFSYQHDVGVLPNGNLTLFDNGEQHSPNYSRGVEYKLDEQNKTATLVWEYRHLPSDIYASAMGSVERLPNGNTIIGWGQASGTSGIPLCTEVDPSNSTKLELFMPTGQISYRAYKYEWVNETSTAKVEQEILQGNTYNFNSSNDTTGITIKFDQLASSLYADVTVSKYNIAPLKPTFNSTAPLTVSGYFNISGLGIDSYTGEFHINLYDYPTITNPKSTIVYSRKAIGDIFSPVSTSYDSTNNELIFTATGFGDYTFGIPQTIDSAFTPSPIFPGNNQIVNGLSSVKLAWGTRGIVQTFHLQVSTDSVFSNLVVDNSSLTSTNFLLSTVNNNSKYYWRVNNTNAAGISNWSNIESFNTASPFVSILFPKGGEKLYLDSTYVIRWVSNIADTVDIKLMNGSNLISVIGDTIFAGTNAFLWKVPSTIKQDSIYRVMLSGISNSTLTSSSNSYFDILSGATGINDKDKSVLDYRLSQNYPNPFNPSTLIEYSIPEESQVQITVYNIIGQKISSLVNGIKETGNYEVTWNASNLSSGVYFYTIKATANSGKSFFTIKKMMLLK